LGDERAQAFMQSMRENGIKLAPSNGDSADQVARGQFAFGLVDSDDAVNRMTQGEPVTMVYPDQGPEDIGCFIVPNAAVLIAGSPHQEAGKKLIDYLLSSETERKLALSDAAQIPLHPDIAAPSRLKPIASIKVMNVDYAAIATKLQAIQPFLKSWTGS
jgi:iron(III) transport system substrate-binding protein